MPPLPLSLKTYCAATSLLEPIAPALLERRARRGKECRLRIRERLGFAAQPRPLGRLVWIHGASVGECLAVLPLIHSLLSEPGRSVLLTSGTVTSAKMMKSRLPPHAVHQFAPVDTPRAVARFLTHWQPDAGVFVDSEIWPNILIAAHAAGVPLAIVNGRMTDRSFAGWNKAKAAAASLFALYEIALAQDNETAAKFKALGAQAVEISGSLKADAPPLPADPVKLEALRREIGDRPLFLATNTHAGEEPEIIRVHDALRAQFPALLSVIVPRHIERGVEIAQSAAPRPVACRSSHERIEAGTEIYVADTMGELGLFYRLASFAFIGKSLAGQGGQNPLEAARLGVAVVAGPHTENFREAYEAIFAAQGFGLVTSSDDLRIAATRLLVNPDEARHLGAAAARAVEALSGALERTRRAVETLLKTHACA
ncbi:MAG TPA: glycosyltransferase N-terminal domain-containing protein [Rhizomicrobium sp.]|nr:glycosyltransferase N-terminal domain-containing protein [Rhizomicrobium sp.]